MGETFVCSLCWGEEVSTDATVRFCKGKQDWVIETFSDCGDWCYGCQENVSLESMPIDDRGEVILPSVEDVAEESIYVGTHVLAKAHSIERTLTGAEYEREMGVLVDAVVREDDVGIAIEMFKADLGISTDKVENLIVNSNSYTCAVHYLKHANSTSDIDRVFNHLIELLVKEHSIKASDFALSELTNYADPSTPLVTKFNARRSYADRLAAVHRLLGGE